VTGDREKHMNLVVGHGWVQIQVRVQPRSSADGIAGVQEGSLKIRLTAPPLEGRANRALQSFLSKRLGIPKSDVEITSGHTSRIKRVKLKGVSTADLHACIPEIRGTPERHDP
jgi:uncharacterized protein (TIGR00251 family)